MRPETLTCGVDLCIVTRCTEKHEEAGRHTVNHEQMLTTREVAAALKVAPETVAKWLRRGRLAGFRLPGGAWRVPEREITRMMTPARAEDAHEAASLV
jgi:excisionase family DNA binding protein